MSGSSLVDKAMLKKVVSIYRLSEVLSDEESEEESDEESDEESE